MTTQDNKALVRRYREAHNANNLALLDEIVPQTSRATAAFQGSLPALRAVRRLTKRSWPLSLMVMSSLKI